MSIPTGDSKTIEVAEGIVLGRLNNQANFALNPTGPVLNMFSPNQLRTFDIAVAMQGRAATQALHQASMNLAMAYYAAMMLAKDVAVFFQIGLGYRNPSLLSEAAINLIDQVEPYAEAALKFGVVSTDEEVDISAPASLTVDQDISAANTNGLDESLGFNAETGQHTVATPTLSAPHGVLGNFNFSTGKYNNFGPPDSATANGPTPEGGTPGSGPGSAPGAGGQAP